MPRLDRTYEELKQLKNRYKKEGKAGRLDRTYEELKLPSPA